jgi:FlaA1/EpsC-like NDP-sugar epimerase
LKATAYFKTKRPGHNLDRTRTQFKARRLDRGAVRHARNRRPRMSRVLITGGAGFIGSHLARHFADAQR